MTLATGWVNDQSGWTTLEDTVFTVSNKLTVAVKTQFIFTGPVVIEVGALSLSNKGPVFGTLFPIQVDDFYIGQVSFKTDVPAGVGHSMLFSIESGGVTIYEDVRAFLFPPASMQPMSFTFLVPATAFTFESGLDIFITPDTSVDMWDLVLTINKTFNIGIT